MLDESVLWVSTSFLLLAAFSHQGEEGKKQRKVWLGWELEQMIWFEREVVEPFGCRRFLAWAGISHIQIFSYTFQTLGGKKVISYSSRTVNPRLSDCYGSGELKKKPFWDQQKLSGLLLSQRRPLKK